MYFIESLKYVKYTRITTPKSFVVYPNTFKVFE